MSWWLNKPLFWCSLLLFHYFFNFQKALLVINFIFKKFSCKVSHYRSLYTFLVDSFSPFLPPLPICLACTYGIAGFGKPVANVLEHLDAAAPFNQGLSNDSSGIGGAWTGGGLFQLGLKKWMSLSSTSVIKMDPLDFCLVTFSTVFCTTELGSVQWRNRMISWKLSLLITDFIPRFKSQQFDQYKE